MSNTGWRKIEKYLRLSICSWDFRIKIPETFDLLLRHGCFEFAYGSIQSFKDKNEIPFFYEVWDVVPFTSRLHLHHFLWGEPGFVFVNVWGFFYIIEKLSSTRLDLKGIYGESNKEHALLMHARYRNRIIVMGSVIPSETRFRSSPSSMWNASKNSM